MAHSDNDLANLPLHLHPLLRYAYGLFKSHAIADEMAILAEFAGKDWPPMDQVAMAHLPGRVHEAFMSKKLLHGSSYNGYSLAESAQTTPTIFKPLR